MPLNAGRRVTLKKGARIGRTGIIATGVIDTSQFPEGEPRIEVRWDDGITRWPLVSIIEPMD